MHEVKVGREVELDHNLCWLQVHLVPVKQKKWMDQDMSSALDAVQHGDMKLTEAARQFGVLGRQSV